VRRWPVDRATPARPRCAGGLHPRCAGPDRRHRAERGFTLLELLVVITVLPLVVGAIAIALLSVFKLQTTVSSRISGSGNAQIVSSNFVRDVQSAALLTTESAPQCGTSGTEVLGLSWSASQTVVAYVELPEGTGNSLFRRVCVNGSATPSSSVVVSHNIPLNQQVVLTCASTVASCSASTGWIATAGVSGVTLTIAEPTGGYQYTLTAVPRAWTPQSGGVAAGGVPVYPLVLLGTASCPSTDLSMIGGSTVTVGGGSGTVGVDSPCASSTTISGASTLSAGSLVTGYTPASGGVSVAAGSSGPSAESYESGGLANPYASLAAPSNPSTSLTGSCSGSSTVTCTSGQYASSPSFGGGATITFTGTSTAPGTFIFQSALTISNGASVSFGNGTYWFEGGLDIQVTASFGSGTYLFGTTGTTASSTMLDVTNGASLSSSGATLWYLEGGSLAFAASLTNALTALTQYNGVTMWDAASGSTLTMSNGSAVSLGGLYAPSGAIIFDGSAPVTAKVVVAATASLSNGVSLAAG
jgi:prepilin-type N-terminal cleavage/methylation domain-containing protein